MGGQRNPDFAEEDSPSRLNGDTEERQSVEELVPDGLADEANVEGESEPSAEEEAVATVVEISQDA